MRFLFYVDIRKLWTKSTYDVCTRVIEKMRCENRAADRKCRPRPTSRSRSGHRLLSRTFSLHSLGARLRGRRRNALPVRHGQRRGRNMGVAQGEDGAVAARRARQGSVARRERRFLLAVNDAGGSSARRERDAPAPRHRRARRRGDRHRRPRTKRERAVFARGARRRDGRRVVAPPVVRSLRLGSRGRIWKDERWCSVFGSKIGRRRRDGRRAAPFDRARPERVG